MEPNAVIHTPRAVPMVTRAAANASSWWINAERGVSIRARISYVSVQRQTV
jgi:hypothetical protein